MTKWLIVVGQLPVGPRAKLLLGAAVLAGLLLANRFGVQAPDPAELCGSLSSSAPLNP